MFKSSYVYRKHFSCFVFRSDASRLLHCCRYTVRCPTKFSFAQKRCCFIPSRLSSSVSEIRESQNLPNTSPLEEDNSTFPAMMRTRRRQAQASVLIETTSQEDTSYAVNLCKELGSIRQAISYAGDSGNEFLLTEFSNQDMVQKLLSTCQFRNAEDSYPVYSRLLRLEKKTSWKKSPSSLHNSSNNQAEPRDTERVMPYKASQMLVENYERQKLTDLSIRKRFLFGCLIEDAMYSMFPYAAALPFGSSVNGFGADGCDLDIVYRLYPEKANNLSDLWFQTRTVSAADDRVLQQRAISCIYEIMRAFLPGVSYIQRVMHARVPILKFRHKILELECDVSVNNMAAACMSEILYFSGKVDYRLRPLVFSVKNWAKQAGITYATPGSWITNFSLTLLVMFFLQNRPVPIMPPLSRALAITASSGLLSPYRVQYKEHMGKWKSDASKNEESLVVLLHQFLDFLATFPFEKKCICLLSGQAEERSDGYPIWLRYPLEEDKNVAKNMSVAELRRLCEIAKISAKHLEAYLTKDHAMDFSEMLGIHDLKKDPSERVNVSEFYGNDVEAVR